MYPIWDAAGRWEFLPTITRSMALSPMKNETQNSKESKLKQIVSSELQPLGTRLDFS